MRNCEKPKYEMVKKLSAAGAKRAGLRVPFRHKAEVRRYAPYLVATVDVEGARDMRDALGKGFMKCAGYIFGKNTREDKIAMTSPVMAEGAGGVPRGDGDKIAMTSPVMAERLPGGGGDKMAMTSPVMAEGAGGSRMRVQFTMPSEWTLDTLPRPVDPDVRVREVPGRTLVAFQWHGGSPPAELVGAYEATLRRVAEDAGVSVRAGAPLLLWQYDPPFSPGWIRTNEVLLEVDPASFLCDDCARGAQ